MDMNTFHVKNLIAMSSFSGGLKWRIRYSRSAFLFVVPGMWAVENLNWRTKSHAFHTKGSTFLENSRYWFGINQQ